MPAHDLQTNSELFRMAQLLRLYGDSKTFPDSHFQGDAATTEREFADFVAQFYHDLGKPVPDQPFEALIATLAETIRFERKLQAWVDERFTKPRSPTLSQPPVRSMESHIMLMWEQLTRNTADYSDVATLIPLPHRYIVPGGRYVEAYYWDSYFTCVGLLAATKTDPALLNLVGSTTLASLIYGMADNFRILIEGDNNGAQGLGYIPNGNRTYYQGRSQAPFFSLMVGLLGKTAGDHNECDYFNALEKEYTFWMDQQPESRRAVVLDSTTILNRYWDSNDSPRPEGYWEDVGAALEAGLPYASAEAHQLYRHFRAAAESGWDFSGRWLAEGADGSRNLTSIRTTHVLPVDLNSLIYALEDKLARLAEDCGHHDKAVAYRTAANQRRQAIIKYFWDTDEHWFVDRCSAQLGVAEDLSLPQLEKTGVMSLAGVYPLFCNVLDPHDGAQQAMISHIIDRIERDFLKKGGVVTSLIKTGQQWDWPNGWAPLQWITVVGLVNYGQQKGNRKRALDIAITIAQAFTGVARQVYRDTGKMMEKYNVVEPDQPGGGGEYPNQDGFGWTNAITTAFQVFLNDPEKPFWQ